MKKNTKVTLTAILLVIVLTVNTSVSKAEYEYWFWDTLAEPLGVIADAGEGVCHGIGDGAWGLWQFIFGKSKRESKQNDLSENLPPA